MPHEGDKRTVTSMGYIPRLPLNNFFLLYTYNKGTVCAVWRGVFLMEPPQRRQNYIEKGTPYAR